MSNIRLMINIITNTDGFEYLPFLGYPQFAAHPLPPSMYTLPWYRGGSTRRSETATLSLE
ncbi:hypothetical protein J6590_007423 [Homalodisca vitripennis]|nr:hypothetical protein J6590_007423 [Homalodisca vitripennis]